MSYFLDYLSCKVLQAELCFATVCLVSIEIKHLSENDLQFFSCVLAVVKGVYAMMPGQIPDPSVTAGSLPSLGPLAGISATTLTDQLKYADLCSLGAMLSPLHLLGKLSKHHLPIKAEVRH